ncbi:MAG: 4Fe-4S binding protein, partial [Nitrososphaerota archaeon]
MGYRCLYYWEMTNLDLALRDLAYSLGADLFGVADLSIAREFIGRQGGEHISRFPRALSVGFRLLDPVVNELHQHENISAIYGYRALYNSVNANLDRIALLLAKKIQELGFKAYPIPPSQTIDNNRLEGIISHKLAANLAGLGWIGKSCLLITPKWGPRVRLTTVLTDAPLKTGTPLANLCDDCRQCVEICPAKAITGIPWNPSEPRDVRFKAWLCKEYVDRRTS